MADVDVDVIVEAISRGFDKVTADMKQIGSASQDTDKKVGGLKATTIAVGAALGSLAAGGLQMVGAAFVSAGKAAAQFAADSVALASDLAETNSLINNSLGPSAEAYRAQLEAISEATGRSANALEMGAQTIVAMSRSMGMAQDEAADFSATMAQIALDLGSFFNQDPAQVFLDLQSAMAGSSETMQKYGIDVREAALQQIALREGIIEAGEKMTTGQRAWALQIGIMEQAADAMGDAARTADGFANSSRALQDTVLDFKLQLGNALLPALNDILGVVNDLAGDALPAFAKALAPELERAAGVVADELERIGDATTEEDIDALARGFGNLASAVIAVAIAAERFGGWLGTNKNLIIDYISLISTAALGPAGPLMLLLADLVQPEQPGAPTTTPRQDRTVRGGGGGFRTTPEIAVNPLQFEGGRGTIIPYFDVAAAEAQAADAAKAAAIAFNDTFQASLQSEGGLDINAMLLETGADMGLGVEQMALLGEAAGMTGEQLRQAAIDAMVWNEAMRLMAEVGQDEAPMSIASMQKALADFREELENWELAVPAIEAAGSKMSRDAMLAAENVSGLATGETATRIMGLREDVDVLSGTHNVLFESNTDELMEGLKPVVDTVDTLSKGATIPLTIDLRYGGNSEGWLIEMLDSYFANQGATP